MSNVDVQRTTRNRARSMVGLFVAVAATGTAMAGASAAATLLAADLNSASWSGVPNAAGVLGTAGGALALGLVIARHGSRSAVRGAYGLAAAGALIAVAGAATGVLPALLVGMLLLGIGNGAAQLSRYLAAELYPAQRQAFGLSVIVWAGTVGAVGGPALLAPASKAATWLGLPGLSGPFLIAAVLTSMAAAVTGLLPRTDPGDAVPPRSVGGLAGLTSVLNRDAVRMPLVAMVAAQVAMVAVMTMTPLQLHHHGHDLEVVGWVLGAHMVGMFALAPISGRLVDRWGGRAAINGGIGLLVVAVVTVVVAPTAHAVGLPMALFLLGYGWNLVFVGGSGVLSRELPAGERAQLQGAVDALIWGTSAIASVLAGQLFAIGGLAAVAIASCVLVICPLVLTARRARRPRRSVT